MRQDTLFILAGNHQEAERYLSNRYLNPGKYYIISQAASLQGYHDITVLCYGSYLRRPDLAQIMSYLNAINARLYEEHQGIYYALPSQPPPYWSSQYQGQYQSQYQSHYQGGQQPSMSIKCRIWWDQALNSYVLSGAYNSKLVEGLKATIPSGSRDHDPQTKFWYFHEQYGEFVRQMAEASFGVGSVSFTSRNVTQQSQQGQSQQGPTAYQAGSRPTTPASLNGGGTTEDVIVAFFNLVPYEVAKKCYLGVSTVLHPDKPTGDAQKMSKLNQLWERIEKEFYKR